MKKEVLPVVNRRFEFVAIAAGLMALGFAACVDAEQTRDEACQDQAVTWCEQIGHFDNESCNRGYFYKCAPVEVEHDKPVDPRLQLQCLDALRTKVNFVNEVVPDECLKLWGAL